MIDLAICVPCGDTVKSNFAFCLAQLTARLEKESVSHMVFFQSGSVLPDQRQALGNQSLQSNSKWTLWLDSDMVFPATVFERLSSHNLDIVAGTYSTRYATHKSVAFMSDDDASQRLTQRTGLHKVNSVGMGCMLMKTSVLETLPAPWFSFIWDNGIKRYSGEDIYFCNLAHDYDIPVFVDAEFSEQLGHTGSNTFTMKDVYDV